MGWVDGLAQSHIVVAANRVAEWLVVHVATYLEVHATTHVFDHQTVATGLVAAEVDVPHIGADEALATGLVGRC